MKITVVLLGITFLLASAAFAAETAVQYQKRLLAQSLSATNVTFCDNVEGARNKSNKKKYDRCHVTRNYLVDIAGSREGAFPPMASESYAANKAEYDQILNRKR